MATDDADADDRENIDPLRGIAVDASPPPSDVKEKSGLYSNSQISPQSLLPISAENKDPHSKSIHCNPANISGNGEESNSTVKKRNVFRPSVFDRQTGHHDRGHNDDMVSNSGSYQNRWKENDKESSGMNKTGWPINDSRNRMNIYCHPPGRWGNSASKEGNSDQQQDNKWNFRWGPTDKGSENWRDKHADSGKQNDASHEKDFSHENNPMKDAERGSNISRSWNSSYLTSHGTRGSYDHPSYDPQKSSPSLGYNRERQQSENPNFTSSHRRFTPSTSRVGSGSSRPFNIGVRSIRPGAISRDTLSYSRMKMLEIYSKIDVRNFVLALPDSETSLLWNEDPAEPFALIACSAEELAILKGIEQGQITNSVEQTCKDDGREDLAGSSEDIKGVTENTKGPGVASLTEPSKPCESTCSSSQKPQSVGDHIHGTAKFMYQNNVLNKGTKIGDMVVLGESEIVGHMQPCPENLPLYYKDPQGQTQGPFSRSQIIDWFEAGYFGVDLLVSVSNPPSDAPFQFLGDVMPHLREKARLPPGFNTLRPSSMPEPSHLGSAYHGLSDNGSINRNDSASEAENPFLEDPMSSKIQNPRAETSCATGVTNEWSNDRFKNNFICGSENVNGINYQVAHKALLERENSFQTAGNVISVAQAQKGTIQCSHAKWLPQMVAPSSETLQPLNADLFSNLLPAVKHQAPTVNSGLQLWSYSVESGTVDLTEGSLSVDHNMHNSQQITHPAKFLGEISQDPVSSGIMHQQYLLQPSLQPQKPAMPQPQGSLFSNMRPLRQQEQHISRMLPDDRSAQQFHDSSYGPKNTLVSCVNTMNLYLQRTQEIIELARYGRQLPDDSSAKMRETDVLGFSESRVRALPLPHEMVGHTPRRECFASLTQDIESSVNEVSQGGIANSLCKKTTTWSNEINKRSADEAKGFPESCQSHARSETVLSNISNQMENSSSNPRTWKLTPATRPKPLLEIQAEEQLKAQRELAMENAKVSVAAASVSSIPLCTVAKSSRQTFGNAARSLGDLENINISSTRSQSYDLLSEKELVKSNDMDGATADVNDESFCRLVPYSTQSGAHSHDDSDSIGVNNSGEKRNKEYKSKDSAINPHSHFSFDPKVISVPIRKDGKQVQKVKEVVYSLSSSQSQRAEAIEFREWCENEWTKLTGTNDTSFLEFCIKQTASEAEILLVDNIGFLDNNRSFIDKFLSYKEFFSADVIDMAFGGRNSPKHYVESPRPGSLGA